MAQQGSPARRESSPTSALVSRTELVNDNNNAVMVHTRSGFDSNEHASTNKGCCKRLLREFWLCMVDLSILMMGVLRAPITGRVIVALVLRLLLYFPADARIRPELPMHHMHLAQAEAW